MTVEWQGYGALPQRDLHDECTSLKRFGSLASVNKWTRKGTVEVHLLRGHQTAAFSYSEVPHPNSLRQTKREQAFTVHSNHSTQHDLATSNTELTVGPHDQWTAGAGSSVQLSQNIQLSSLVHCQRAGKWSGELSLRQLLPSLLLRAQAAHESRIKVHSQPSRIHKITAESVSSIHLYKRRLLCKRELEFDFNNTVALTLAAEYCRAGHSPFTHSSPPQKPLSHKSPNPPQRVGADEKTVPQQPKAVPDRKRKPGLDGVKLYVSGSMATGGQSAHAEVKWRLATALTLQAMLSGKASMKERKVRVKAEHKPQPGSCGGSWSPWSWSALSEFDPAGAHKLQLQMGQPNGSGTWTISHDASAGGSRVKLEYKRGKVETADDDSKTAMHLTTQWGPHKDDCCAKMQFFLPL